jgi:hypothetical protein
VNLDTPTIRILNKYRQKRNTANYERVGMISKSETAEMIELAQSLKSIVIGWVKSNHPQLLDSD